MGENKNSNLKKLDEKLYLSFEKLKEDILNLKRSKSKNSKELNYLNLRQVAIEKRTSSRSEVHELMLRLGGLEKEIKQLDELSKSSEVLKKESLKEKEFIKNKKQVSNEIDNLNKAILRLNKRELSIQDEKIKEVESKILSDQDVKEVVLEQISKNCLRPDEFFKELDKIKKENSKLYDRITLVKKEILNFHKTKFFANTVLFIALMSFIGSAISLKFSYVDAANFFGIEGLFLLALGLLIHIIIALKK